jgi:sugar phosphate isomerase/epimerase
MLRRVRDETGLRVAGILNRLAALEVELDREIDFCQQFECRHITLSWLDPEERRDVSRLAERLNALGRRCREAEITFSHHNHDFEFVRTDGGVFLDELLAATDPHLVALELDVYWAAYAGADPVTYLRRYAGRIPLLHLKDMSEDRSFADVGEGILDMEGILRSAADGGTRWYIVENDQPGPQPLESARRSLENLRKMTSTRPRES